MAENKSSKVMQDYEKVNRLIDGLTLFDDDLMSRVFDKNIEATELILRIILGRKIKVIRVNGQEEVRSGEGRSAVQKTEGFLRDLYLQARQVQKRVTGIPYRPIYKRDRGNLRGRITYRICKREL